MHETDPGIPIVMGGQRGRAPPPSNDFFRKPPIKTDAPPHGAPSPLKNETPHLKNKPPHWNVKYPSMKWFLEKAQ